MTSVLDPNLMPARKASLEVSDDVPSNGDLRPFGLTRGTLLADGEAMTTLDGMTYDPARQVNVDTDGRPVVDSPLTPQMGTSTDTQHDMQWFVDKD